MSLPEMRVTERDVAENSVVKAETILRFVNDNFSKIKTQKRNRLAGIVCLLPIILIVGVLLALMAFSGPDRLFIPFDHLPLVYNIVGGVILVGCTGVGVAQLAESRHFFISMEASLVNMIDIGIFENITLHEINTLRKSRNFSFLFLQREVLPVLCNHFSTYVNRLKHIYNGSRDHVLKTRIENFFREMLDDANYAPFRERTISLFTAQEITQFSQPETFSARTSAALSESHQPLVGPSLSFGASSGASSSSSRSLGGVGTQPSAVAASRSLEISPRSAPLTMPLLSAGSPLIWQRSSSASPPRALSVEASPSQARDAGNSPESTGQRVWHMPDHSI